MTSLALVLAALLHVPGRVGYLALAALIGVESSGVPVPGETALIAAAIVARHGDLDITLVIVVAAAAAIMGDNIGYWIGRKGGRALLRQPGPFLEHRSRIIERGEPFFARHGPKAVFLGRWIALLRIAAAWLAGVNRMPWRTFLFWNALGGIAWAVSVGVAAYLLGRVAETIVRDAGIAGVALLAVLAVLLMLWSRRASRW